MWPTCLAVGCFILGHFPGSPLRHQILESLRRRQGSVFLKSFSSEWNAAGPGTPTVICKSHIGEQGLRKMRQCVFLTFFKQLFYANCSADCAAAQDREKYKGRNVQPNQAEIVHIYPALTTPQALHLALYAISQNVPHNNPRIWKLLFSFFYQQGNRGLKAVKELVSVTQIASGRTRVRTCNLSPGCILTKLNCLPREGDNGQHRLWFNHVGSSASKCCMCSKR